MLENLKSKNIKYIIIILRSIQKIKTQLYG